MSNQYKPTVQVPSTLCLNCMEGYIVGGRCNHCEKPNTDEGRPPHALPFGYSLKRGRYLLGRVLGNGGFGITYLAWDNAGRRRIAIKELCPGSADYCQRDPTNNMVVINPEKRQFFQHVKRRFVDEARLLSYLRDDPDILDIYDFFEANGTAYYAMEYLDGMDLQHMLARNGRALSWQQLEQPMYHVLRGLGTLHGHGLIHRDISPDNIFVCNNGKAKLIDFGSARREDADHFTTILKAVYAPPELFLSNGNQGFWTDTFSLCATLYYLLNGGELPVKVFDRSIGLDAKGVDPLKPLSQFKPNAPAYVVNAVMRGMSLDIEARFKSVEEMQNALFPGRRASRSEGGCTIVCTHGRFMARRYTIPAGKYVTLGRGEGTNTIGYPDNPQLSPGISRRHCVFFADREARLYVQDQNSRYGTFVNFQRIPPMSWVEVKKGQKITVGGEEYALIDP